MAAASSAVLWIAYGENPPPALSFGSTCEGIICLMNFVAKYVFIVFGYQADDLESIKLILAKRERVYSIVAVFLENNLAKSFLDDKAYQIGKYLSVIYGRFKRPVLLVSSRGPSGLLSVRRTSSDGICDVQESVSDEHIFSLIQSCLENIVQPNEYLLKRNVMEEPTWLVDAVGNCFDHPDLDAVFPEPSAEDHDSLFELCESRSFHSPSLSDSACLLSVMYIFDSLNLLTELDVDRERFKSFLLALHRNYKPNPYHNFQHAVDVLQFAYLMLRKAPELTELLEPIEIFAILLAAIGHDVGHTSYNNQFHYATESLLSVLFNDQSALESFHSLLVFAILRHPRYNFCQSWTADRWVHLRRLVIACILGTDMAKHFHYIRRFSEAQLGAGCQLDPESRTHLAVLVIKCADISNIIRPFDVARRWGFKLVSEFFCLGDWERYLGQQPSFLTDRFTFDLARSQENFMLQVAGPLFRFAAEAFPGTAFCMEALEANVQSWREWSPEEDEIVQASEDFRPYIRTKP